MATNDAKPFVPSFLADLVALAKRLVELGHGESPRWGFLVNSSVRDGRNSHSVG